MSEVTHKYAVPPTSRYFNTRHKAVGFAAIHGRQYTYSPMNSIDDSIPLRVEPFEVTVSGGHDE